MADSPYTVGVIGHSGRGNYGHGLDTVWAEVPNTRVIAVADADPAGLNKAAQRLPGANTFSDYKKLLTETKPTMVSIAPRWPDQHQDMVLAACQAGVKGIYLEKPMCRNLREADAIVDACEKHHVKLAIAFQTRYSPVLQVINDLIDEGKLGEVLELRGHGKEDRRGGGEDLWVLGSHVMNLIHFFGGEPTWCSSKLYQDRQLVRKEHVASGNEGLGPLASNKLTAMWGLHSGATAYFRSQKSMGSNPARFGLSIYGTEGLINMTFGYLPDVHWLPDPTWNPGKSGKEWIPISSNGAGKPETLKIASGLHAGNVRACEDLIRAIEGDVQTETSPYEGRTTIEMIAGVFESHRTGRTVDLPLTNRDHPLAMLE